MKAVISHLSPECNPGKLDALETLHRAYRDYVQACIQKLVQDKRPRVFPSEFRTYFPPTVVLSSQIAKNAHSHAAEVVWAWVQGLYARKLRDAIRSTPDLTDKQRLELRCIGKYGLRNAGKFGKGTISQEMVDLYWGWVWNPEVVGNPPAVSDDFPMWMTEMTCVYGPSKGSTHFGWWLRFSSLKNGHRVEVPLACNPRMKDGLAKTVLVKKRFGRWTFQFFDKTPDEVFDGSAGKIGVDVGLNVIAATSDGRLFGRNFKPRFDTLYKKVRMLRANRQRQGLERDSKRLARLEQRLSGQIKTATGTVANQLVRAFPKTTFVIENLDLRGCRGQKRFAYRALHHALTSKAAVEVVNPAYTSQTCPSCGYVSRKNRNGVSFECRSCGRVSHADVVGATNLLGRSEDEQVERADHPSAVRSVLKERFRRRRASSSARSNAPVPSGRKLTTRRTRSPGAGTASNPMPKIT